MTVRCVTQIPQPGQPQLPPRPSSERLCSGVKFEWFQRIIQSPSKINQNTLDFNQIKQQFDRMKIVLSDPDQIIQFLVQHPELISYLEEASQRINQLFPDTNQLKLRLSFDPEFDNYDPWLILSVPTALEVSEARERLDRFDMEWWVNLPENIRRIFFVTEEYV